MVEVEKSGDVCSVIADSVEPAMHLVGASTLCSYMLERDSVSLKLLPRSVRQLAGFAPRALHGAEAGVGARGCQGSAEASSLGWGGRRRVVGRSGLLCRCRPVRLGVAKVIGGGQVELGGLLRRGGPRGGRR